MLLIHSCRESLHFSHLIEGRKLNWPGWPGYQDCTSQQSPILVMTGWIQSNFVDKCSQTEKHNVTTGYWEILNGFMSNCFEKCITCSEICWVCLYASVALGVVCFATSQSTKAITACVVHVCDCVPVLDNITVQCMFLFRRLLEKIQSCTMWMQTSNESWMLFDRCLMLKQWKLAAI